MSSFHESDGGNSASSHQSFMATSVFGKSAPNERAVDIHPQRQEPLRRRLYLRAKVANGRYMNSMMRRMASSPLATLESRLARLRARAEERNVHSKTRTGSMISSPASIAASRGLKHYESAAPPSPDESKQGEVPSRLLDAIARTQAESSRSKWFRPPRHTLYRKYCHVSWHVHVIQNPR